MPRSADAPSRIEILVLSSLARLPMHGYEIKAELRYKHAKWWAKADHGHLYAAITRLEKHRFIQPVAGSGVRGKRVYKITAGGRRRLVRALGELGRARDSTYFDIDLFLSSTFVLDRTEVLDILKERRALIADQLAEAQSLRQNMSAFVPTVGRLIMDHRVEHLARELAFIDRAAESLRAEQVWGSFLGNEKIGEFLERTHVPLEED